MFKFSLSSPQYIKHTTIKVKLSIGMTNLGLLQKHIWDSGGISPTFLLSVLGGDEWLTS
jgi:hypothetical protein